MNKMPVSTHFLAFVVGAVLAGYGARLWTAAHDLAPPVVDRVAARQASVDASCELGASGRALFREDVNSGDDGLENRGACSVDWCDGDAPVACPRDTPLAATGEPADPPAEQVLEDARLREEVREEVEAEVAAERAAEAEAASD